MRSVFYIAIIFLFPLGTIGQFNPEPKKLTELHFPEVDSLPNHTPALKKKKGFTDYTELIKFLEEQCQKHPELASIEYIGATQKGLKIPMLKIKSNKNPQDKIRVWLQGGLHGNEPGSTEGVLYMIYELLNNPSHSYLLDRIEFAVVPMANIDGYLKLDRYAANGLDLNRDQTKLVAIESISLKKAYSTFNPQVALDFHEYNPYRRDFAKLASFGISSAYDVMFLYSNNLNVPSKLRALIDTSFVEEARKRMDFYALRHHDYISTEHNCGEIHFKQGSTNARSSATSYALSNTISALIEVRGVNLGRTSFKRRIRTSCLVGLSFIEAAYKQADQIQKHIDEATQTKQDVVVKTKTKSTIDTIEVIDMDNFQLMRLPITVKNAKDAEPAMVRQAPRAYILPVELGHLIEKLSILGLKIDTLEQTLDFQVEAYRVVEYEKSSEPYEKMTMQYVTTETFVKQMSFPKGTFIVYTNQKNKGLLYETLEPETNSGFVTFGLVQTALNQELPFYRLMPVKE